MFDIRGETERVCMYVCQFHFKMKISPSRPSQSAPYIENIYYNVFQPGSRESIIVRLKNIVLNNVDLMKT